MKANVKSSQTPESIFEREARHGMLSWGGVNIFRTLDRERPFAVGVTGADYDKARRFRDVAEAFDAFPGIRANCEREALIPLWEDHLRAALEETAAEAGFDVAGLGFDHAVLDNTWGDRCGLVFYGASDAAVRWAAATAKDWISAHGDAHKIFAGSAQRSLSIEGERHFARYSNGVSGWYRKPAAASPTLSETRTGFAVSFVYYPGSD
jgi:hypothetical protein